MGTWEIEVVVVECCAGNKVGTDWSGNSSFNRLHISIQSTLSVTMRYLTSTSLSNAPQEAAQVKCETGIKLYI